MKDRQKERFDTTQLRIRRSSSRILSNKSDSNNLHCKLGGTGPSEIYRGTWWVLAEGARICATKTVYSIVSLRDVWCLPQHCRCSPVFVLYGSADLSKGPLIQ